MAPDNGLLGRLLTDAEDATVFRLDPGTPGGALNIANPSATFHGRDVFRTNRRRAGVSRQYIDRRKLGQRTSDEWIPAWLDEPDVLCGKSKWCRDHVRLSFGNLITNIDAALDYRFAGPGCAYRGSSAPTVGNLQSRQDLATTWRSSIRSVSIEIARAEGSAAEGLGADRGAPRLSLRHSLLFKLRPGIPERNDAIQIRVRRHYGRPHRRRSNRVVQTALLRRFRKVR